MNFFIKLTTTIFLTIFFSSLVLSFDEYAIFEDEDIYRQALPPEPNSTGLTLPGTKWCGPGDTAQNYNDLGSQRETDMCCRAHDHCSEIIESKQSLHGLQNPDMFPRLKCECEQEFLNCLQKVNNYASSAIGRAYFAARSLCFKEEYPLLECKLYQQGMIMKRCVKYKFDKTKPKQWQWFNIPYFTGS